MRAHISPSHTDTVISHFFFLTSSWASPCYIWRACFIFIRAFIVWEAWWGREREVAVRKGCLPQGRGPRRQRAPPDSATFVLHAAALPQMMQGFADTEAYSETTAFMTAIVKQHLLLGGISTAGKWKTSTRNTLLCLTVGMTPGHREPVGD